MNDQPFKLADGTGQIQGAPSIKHLHVGSASRCYALQRASEPCSAGMSVLFHRVVRGGRHERDFSWMIVCR